MFQQYGTDNIMDYKKTQEVSGGTSGDGGIMPVQNNPSKYIEYNRSLSLWKWQTERIIKERIEKRNALQA